MPGNTGGFPELFCLKKLKECFRFWHIDGQTGAGDGIAPLKLLLVRHGRKGG